MSGFNLTTPVPGQLPFVVNGQNTEVFYDKAVVLHVSLPEDKCANVGIINIFEPDENSPVIEFAEDTYSVEKCLIDGKEVSFANYLSENNIDIKVPILGRYYSADINVSFFKVEDGVVYLGAPVFKGVQYRFGKGVSDYPAKFNHAMEQFKGVEEEFACNCVFNFLFGGLQGKKIDYFHGPTAFGEIAYQLMNQTLVYLVVN